MMALLQFQDRRGNRERPWKREDGSVTIASLTGMTAHQIIGLAGAQIDASPFQLERINGLFPEDAQPRWC